MAERHWRLVELARLAGVTDQQVRNYLAAGLLPPAERAANNYRVLTDHHADALRAVRALAAGHGWSRARAILTAVHAGDIPGALAEVDDSHADLPAERQLPFATIVTGDHYDDVSNLDRPDVYRLNIGLTKATYAAVVGGDQHAASKAGFDYAALDTVMPHPVYGSQHWVCVLNPGEASLDTVRKLLAEAHEFAARKYANWQTRRQPS